MADEKISELDAKTTLGAADLFAIMDEAAAPDQTKKITWADVLKALNKIVDPTDQDTYVEAGEDFVKMVVATVEAFNLDSNGILTTTKQSRARAYQNAAQEIPTSSTTHILLDTENYDEQGEFNNRVVSGAADATEANKLHDADGGFEAADVGATVWNTIDNTYTTVAAFVDSGELTLTDDIMVDTETYKLFHSRHTVTVAGTYLVVGGVTHTDLDDQKQGYAVIQKNGADYLSINKFVSSVGAPNISPLVLDIMELAATDYITLATWHDQGADATLVAGAARTFLSVAKIG